MKTYFIELFQYNDWANEQLIEHIRFLEQPPERCLRLISHILSAQDMWMERIAGTHDWNIQIWDLYTIQECSLLSVQSSQQWFKLIRKLKDKDYDKLIVYKNLNGNACETPIRQIITHVAQHSTYHRGQINLLLKQNNIPPVELDYIYYSRL
ncbi:MAG: damage-inducible protein DinB [Ignavibacteriae bacterium HGW-Ignavibacteriae-2]|jgi:uncharacterized damage-inducible protein DinB|nr:DinB family protein [Bacteroidota bacterium]PKL90098.1 MAG: damage-inducible protein DinB [Ignavibacteriae bacterium HGW-Ignavibacteriae-2]